MTRPALALAFALALTPAPAFAQDAAPAAGATAAPPADAAEARMPSLMFTPEERLVIEAAIRDGGLDADGATGAAAGLPLRPRLRTPLYLSGILYGGPQNWTVWLNGQRLTPERDDAGLYRIEEVTDRSVLLSVDWGETSRLVLLEPNQTFVPQWSKVLEGRVY